MSSLLAATTVDPAVAVPSLSMVMHAAESVRRRATMIAVPAVCVLALVACSGPGSTTSAADGEAVTASTVDRAGEQGGQSDEISAEESSEAGATPDGADGGGGDEGDRGDESDETVETVTVDVESGSGTDDDPERSVPAQSVTALDVDGLDGAELEDFLATRYEAFWDTFSTARTAPTTNPGVDFPTLADLAADEQLEAAHTELTALATNGEALRSPETPALPGLDADSAHRIRVDRVDDAVAELAVCFVNDRISYRVADGEVISDVVVTVTAEATMARTEGTWKLIRSRAIALDPGVSGCWLEDESSYPL